jgi:hypothetical protein
MKQVCTALCAAALMTSAASATTVNVGDSTSPWLGFMNVYELDSNGGAFVFASGWGVPDLNTSFDDGLNTLTMSPNTVGDPDPFWYQGGGAPGALGNKKMEANLYQEVTDGFAGKTVSFTAAHDAVIFIRDYAADFSSFTETSVAATAGAFSISLATDAGAGRHVQWGFQVTGENVWETDTAPFGNMVISTVPAPTSLAILGLGGLVATRRRR